MFFLQLGRENIFPNPNPRTSTCKDSRRVCSMTGNGEIGKIMFLRFASIVDRFQLSKCHTKFAVRKSNNLQSNKCGPTENLEHPKRFISNFQVKKNLAQKAASSCLLCNLAAALATSSCGSFCLAASNIQAKICFRHPPTQASAKAQEQTVASLVTQSTIDAGRHVQIEKI